MTILLACGRSALLTAAIASALAATPATASLYMGRVPGLGIGSIRLPSTGASGQFHSLVIDEKTAEGYRVVKSSLSAARVGGEVTIDIWSATLYGTRRLDGTIHKDALSLSAQAEDGTICRLSFTEVSEGRWNAAVARFKQIAKAARLGYEFRWWSDQEQEASAQIASNKPKFPGVKAERVAADQGLEAASKTLESGRRRLAAAEKVYDAADKLSDACLDSDSLESIHSAKVAVERAEQVVQDEAKHIRGDEPASLGRLASAQHDLEEETRAIQSEPSRSNSNYDAQSAGYGVQRAAFAVQRAVFGLQRVIFELERDEQAAASRSETAAASVRSFEQGFAKDNARIQEARLQMREIASRIAALKKRIGPDPKRP